MNTQTDQKQTARNQLEKLLRSSEEKGSVGAKDVAEGAYNIINKEEERGETPREEIYAWVKVAIEKRYFPQDEVVIELELLEGVHRDLEISETRRIMEEAEDCVRPSGKYRLSEEGAKKLGKMTDMFVRVMGLRETLRGLVGETKEIHPRDFLKSAKETFEKIETDIKERRDENKENLLEETGCALRILNQWFYEMENPSLQETMAVSAFFLISLEQVETEGRGKPFIEKAEEALKGTSFEDLSKIKSLIEAKENAKGPFSEKHILKEMLPLWDPKTPNERVWNHEKAGLNTAGLLKVVKVLKEREEKRQQARLCFMEDFESIVTTAEKVGPIAVFEKVKNGFLMTRKVFEESKKTSTKEGEEERLEEGLIEIEQIFSVLKKWEQEEFYKKEHLLSIAAHYFISLETIYAGEGQDFRFCAEKKAKEIIEKEIEDKRLGEEATYLLEIDGRNRLRLEQIGISNKKGGSSII